MRETPAGWPAPDGRAPVEAAPAPAPAPAPAALLDAAERDAAKKVVTKVRKRGSDMEYFGSARVNILYSWSTELWIVTKLCVGRRGENQSHGRLRAQE